MQQVKVTCPTCADDFLLAPSEISATENRIAAECAQYTFTCPGCGGVITKPAGREVLGLLRLAIGVRWSVVSVPTELSEPHHGPAFTEQDVQDFMIDLGLTPAHLIAILAGGDK